MPIPRQEITIRDPGLGTVPQALDTPLVMGTCEKGTVNVIEEFTSKADVIDTFGQGPLSEDICYMLDIGGGPILGMRLTGSVAGAAGAVTPTLVGSATGTVTVANAPLDSYEVQITIVKTGTLGVAEFQYSLDDGRSQSEIILMPAGGVYDIPDTSLELTFVPGAGAVFFEAGDLHEFDCTAPGFSTTNFSDGITAVLLTPTEFAFVVLSGEPASTSDGATLFATVATQMAALKNQFRYVGAIMDAGSPEDSAATAISDHASSESTRIALCYGDCDLASSKPISGWGTPRRSIATVIAGRAHAVKISTDLARVASGSLPGVVAIRDDEFRNPQGLNAQKFSTLRTWQGTPGFYVMNAKMRSGLGSDFVYWQHRRVMDVACDTTVKTQAPFISKAVRTNEDGTINDTDARAFEATAQSALRANLKDPNNDEGTPGHVSDFGYNIDRKNDVLTTFTVKSKVAIRPLGYAKILETEIGFSKAV